MDKNPKPTPEELRFVYQMILNGYGDTDILNEYAHLYDMGQLKFPYRVDDRFIKDRRKELQAASEVLEEHVKKKADPVISKRRDEHFERLAKVADTLLDNNLHTVVPNTECSAGEPQYLVEVDWVSSGYPLEKSQLTMILQKNIGKAYNLFEPMYFHKNFLPHLRAEIPIINIKGIWDFIEEQPYELIENLRILVERKTFKGTCPICEDWQ